MVLQAAGSFCYRVVDSVDHCSFDHPAWVAGVFRARKQVAVELVNRELVTGNLMTGSLVASCQGVDTLAHDVAHTHILMADSQVADTLVADSSTACTWVAGMQVASSCSRHLAFVRTSVQVNVLQGWVVHIDKSAQATIYVPSQCYPAMACRACMRETLLHQPTAIACSDQQ